MLSLLSLNAFAEAPVEPKGAFGINFGDKIDILKVKDEVPLSSGEKMYLVEAPQPLTGRLDRYYVQITPKTNVVFSIWGDRDYERVNRDKCNTEKKEIVNLLENKYGESESTGIMNIDDDRYFGFANSRISASCRNLGSNLSIRYVNKKLSELYTEEKKELVIEKTDASML